MFSCTTEAILKMRLCTILLLGFIVIAGVAAQEDHVDVPQTDCAADIDLIILVDGSSSVKQSNFALIKEWIKNLAKSFNLESGHVQIGVVQYSYWNYKRPMWRQTYIRTEIRLGRYKTLKTFNKAVDRIRYQGYQTFTAHALNKIVDYDFQGRNSRYPQAQRVIILLTDGKATDGIDLQEAVDHAENDAKAVIFAVGVGDYSIEELKLITHNNAERIFELENFSDLEKVVYKLPTILEAVCDCHPQGRLSNDCDPCTRQCLCKPNVTGRRCDNCTDGSYNMTSPLGCMACDCDTRGAIESVICDKNSGNCLCRTGVDGDKCDRCLDGRFGFPECELCECNGFAERCDKASGTCIDCRQSRAGDHCETCKPGYYMTGSGHCVACQCNGHIDVNDPQACNVTTGECLKCLHGAAGLRCESCAKYFYGNATTEECKTCQCDLAGTDPSTCDEDRCECESTTGQCECLAGITGLQCSTCDDGFWRATEAETCEACRCEAGGSQSPICDKVTGKCPCIQGYVGDRCHLCDVGYFQSSTGDCVECACSLPGTNQTTPIDGVGQCEDITGQCPCFEGVEGLKCDRCEELHWGYESGDGCVPCACGAGSLSQQCHEDTGECECLPGYFGEWCEICEAGYFESEGRCLPCDCSPLGRDESECDGDVCFCKDVSGQCSCLPGVVGITCDSCDDGYWRNGLAVGCEPCGCDGLRSLSSICNKETGKCECLPGYTGAKCDKCERGHFRSEENDLCRECDCNMSGTDTEQCVLGVCECDASTAQCPCLANVAGLTCDECEDQYWDFGGEGGCKKCGCHGSGSLSYACDKKTGKCECLPGHTGDKCDKCEKGFSRKNAIDRCKDCRCDMSGTDPDSCDDGNCACNPVTGQCPCLPAVTGLLCSRCEDEYWGLTLGEGCKTCECSPEGSQSLVCDKDTGDCSCRAGYTGKKCDQCDRGFFSKRPLDKCEACVCYMYGRDPSSCRGATCDCQASSGQCKCLPNVAGLACDRCNDGFWNIRSMRGCQSCDCDKMGTANSSTCEEKLGKCKCREGYDGRRCDKCARDYARSEPKAECKPSTRNDEDPSTTAPPRTEKTTTTRTRPRPIPTRPPTRPPYRPPTRPPYRPPYRPPTRPPYRPPTTRYVSPGCNRCRTWPSYCYGWMCRRRWPQHKFTPSSRRCGYGHTTCQHSVANRYGHYETKKTTVAPITKPTARSFYGYTLYGNSGFNYRRYPARTYSRSRSYSGSSSRGQRSRPMSYGLYRSLYRG